MKISVTTTSIEGLLVIQTDCFTDERGFIMEPWNKRDFLEAGINAEFVQEAHSQSKNNVLRGLHYQNMSAPMAKLVRVTRGKVYDIAVDLRVDSPTFGKWEGIELSEENKKQVFIPVGFAHGFLTLTDIVDFQYKQTNYYAPQSEGGIIWNDRTINVNWPTEAPILSEKDSNLPTFEDYKSNPAFK